MNKTIIAGVVLALLIVGISPDSTQREPQQREKALPYVLICEKPKKATGNDLSTNQAKSFEATAYTWECGNGDGVTATGTVPTPGRTVAVDPRVIPYGSELIINGVGGYIAEDTGGAIQGQRIDIFFDTYQEAILYGRQMVTVEIKEGE